MIKYVKPVPEFEALQFQGGRESASILSVWLRERGISTTWFDAVPELTLEPADDAAEGTSATVIKGQTERFVALLGWGALEVRVSDWIVIDADDNPYRYPDDQFNTFFTEKRGD